MNQEKSHPQTYNNFSMPSPEGIFFVCMHIVRIGGDGVHDPILRRVLPFLPAEVRQALERMPPTAQKRLEELRFRNGCEISHLLNGEREAALSVNKPLFCTSTCLQSLLNAASGYSVYASDDYLCQGFLPLPGGHRLGFCGTVVLQGTHVVTMKDISSANLRIAREWLGCAEEVANSLSRFGENTLVIGPPNCGKTTLIRDLARQLSDKYSFRVGIVDGRGEIAACFEGTPQLSVGQRTDVISMVPKSVGMEMLLRNMSPEWIILDEITAFSDVEEMMRASYSGVRIIATAHAFRREDLNTRPIYRRMLELGIFKHLIIMDSSKQVRLERMEGTC